MSTNFWSTIKPYLSKKACNSQNKTILNGSNTGEVSEIFKSYFVNVAYEIGKNYIFNPSNHPSLEMIDDKNFEKDVFNLKE